ncbi:glutamate 5-kinase [Alphaproteobacteria bacterium]|nr:glutamate 5-kinase [Alphaproteobacteria bacterium]
MDSFRKKLILNSSRIVIKVGSSLLVNTKNKLINKKILNNICKDIFYLINQNKEIIIVSSGALAMGRKALNILDLNLKISEKQAIASIGQVLMVNSWRETFSKYKISCGQILLTHHDAETRRSSINARNTIEALIKLNAIAIINENDTVATKELRYGDNDQLAARVAQISSADLLIVLSDIDGLFESNPEKNPKAKLIEKVSNIDRKIERISENTSSSNSVGGMETKIKAAKISLAAGCNMVITRGNLENPIKKLLENGKATWFISKTSPRTARKKWISSQIKSKGSIIIDNGAEIALRKGASLLPAGILEVNGKFLKGDTIKVFNEKKKLICIGFSSYPSADARKIAGFKSNEIKKVLGYHQKDVVIHRDDMVIKNEKN